MIDINNIPEILPFKDDYIFKAMLTRYDTGLIRNSMISAFTGLKIVSSEVAENEPAADAVLLEKEVRFDVNCTTDDGTKVQIEMQAHRMANDTADNEHINLRVRSLYYMGKLFVGQRTKHYSDMDKAIQIMICDYVVFDDDRFIHKFYYKDGDLVLSDYCSIIYVELPKIKKSISKPVDEMTDDERWAVFIEYVNDNKFKEKAHEFEAREEFKEAMESLSRVTQSDRDYNHYMSRLKYEMDKATEMHYAKEEGIQIGTTNTLIETAINFLRNGFAPADVAKGVKLPLADIEALQKKL
ncbi:MAG: Rpn family recombination-promoting nuclease/putative transposase [Ruminococcus sp.]|nr:Rpn family recombination-promoting nuclease/putative transposase [Ruminococcus sp.]